MKVKIESKKNIIFSFNVLGKGVTVYFKTPFKKDTSHKEVEDRKSRKFRYF